MHSDRKRQFANEASAVRQGALAFFSTIETMEARGVGNQAPGMAGIAAAHIPAIARVLSQQADHKTIALLELIGLEAAIGIGIGTAAKMVTKTSDLDPPLRIAVVTAISRALRQEMEALQFWAGHPGRARMLEERAKEERMSKAKAARVWRRAATRIGFVLQHWSPEDGAHAATAILMAAVGTGLLRITSRQNPSGQGVQHLIQLSHDTLQAVHDARSSMSERAIMRKPMLCEPDPWGKGKHGGFLSQPAKDAFRIVSGNHRDENLQDDMPAKFAALNGLQETRLRIDRQVLDTVKRVVREIGMHVISGHPGPNPPPFPPHIQNIPYENRTKAQHDEVEDWKLRARDYYQQLHGACQRAARVRRCIMLATEYENEPVFWQAWHCDLTGRFYPGNSGPSTMGSDVQKGLVQFAEGLPIDTPEAEAYYRRGIAQLWGATGTNTELEQWSRDHEPMILAIAADPLASRQWMEADSPYQFLRQCFDYAGWIREGKGWLSHVPIELDGKTNGLQHIACMSRDEELAISTNLTEDPEEHDLYMEAAEEMRVAIMHDPASSPLARQLATLPANRKLGKKPVMGIPYGMKALSARDYFHKQIKEGVVPEIARADRRKCAADSFTYLWQAAGQVTSQARPVMKALREIAKALLRDGGGMITLRGPSGFVMRQRMESPHVIKTQTRTFGNIAWLRDEGDIDSRPRRHMSHFPPNAIHLCDAEAMTYSITAANHRGIRDVWMNHDSFGCHAKHAPQMARIAREAMIWVHGNNDMYGKWLAMAGMEDARGSFDLRRILQSIYSFR